VAMTADLVTTSAPSAGTVVPTAPSTDVAQVTAAWLASRRSPHTRRAYASDLDGWLRWCATVDLDPLAARRRHVQVWVAQHHAGGAAAATTARKLAAVSSWYRCLAAEDLVGVVPTLEVDRAPVDADDSTVLGLDQAAAVALLRTAAADTPRTHALVALLMLRALRVAEALALDVADVTDTVRGHRVARVHGKGGRRRIAALPPAVARAVDALIDGRTEGPLFLTRTGARWSPSGAYRTVRRVARDAGLPHPERVHPHALRHTAVTLALDSGANLVDVQDMAGHADPRTTRRYDRARGRLDRDPSYALAALLDVG
jgi:integrase/recombinase XerD